MPPRKPTPRRRSLPWPDVSFSSKVQPTTWMRKTVPTKKANMQIRSIGNPLTPSRAGSRISDKRDTEREGRNACCDEVPPPSACARSTLALPELSNMSMRPSDELLLPTCSSASTSALLLLRVQCRPAAMLSGMMILDGGTFPASATSAVFAAASFSSLTVEVSNSANFAPGSKFTSGTSFSRSASGSTPTAGTSTSVSAATALTPSTFCGAAAGTPGTATASSGNGACAAGASSLARSLCSTCSREMCNDVCSRDMRRTAIASSSSTSGMSPTGAMPEPPASGAEWVRHAAESCSPHGNVDFVSDASPKGTKAAARLKMRTKAIANPET
mmetsp:Transcript_59725/g.172359  ORF Transcript_59725/g.172359 Transcript_59725/m.172359 type:complete len:330 (-) Transcript_59725:71-1060(-)